MIRKLSRQVIPTPLELVREVFMEFLAPVYSQEGTAEFLCFLQNRSELERLRFFGAWNREELAGVLEMRENHISLLLVKKESHRKGMAIALFSYMLEQGSGGPITVNSSPYAQAAYEKLGFTPTASEQLENGIRYIPMVYIPAGDPPG